jgi:ELWxxDGT repeat protein
MFNRLARKSPAARAAARPGKAVAAIEILEGRRLLAGVPWSYPSYLAVAYDTLFFTATPDDVGTGGEVFRSDGTEAGTYLVKDVAAGRNGSNANYYTPFNGAVYFSAEGPPFVSEEPGHGTNVELWRTDGTPEGTRLVRDINPGMGQSFPYNLFTAGNALYFTAVDDVHGRELWKTDGTEAGTVPVKDLNPGAGQHAGQHPRRRPERAGGLRHRRVRGRVVGPLVLRRHRGRHVRAEGTRRLLGREPATEGRRRLRVLHLR